jgi:hypothetical protein
MDEPNPEQPHEAFQHWLHELACDQLYTRVFGLDEPDHEVWRSHFESGLSPNEAILEEIDAGSR